MWTRHHRNRRLGVLVVPLLAAGFLSYFGYHAFEGDYGLHANYRLEARIDTLKGELAELSTQRGELERRLRLLHDGTLDRDMLDEQVRRKLNYVHPNEVVIVRGRGSID
jgi:cell division protein FtsB